MLFFLSVGRLCRDVCLHYPEDYLWVFMTVLVVNVTSTRDGMRVKVRDIQQSIKLCTASFFAWFYRFRSCYSGTGTAGSGSSSQRVLMMWRGLTSVTLSAVGFSVSFDLAKLLNEAWWRESTGWFRAINRLRFLPHPKLSYAIRALQMQHISTSENFCLKKKV